MNEKEIELHVVNVAVTFCLYLPIESSVNFFSVLLNYHHILILAEIAFTLQRFYEHGGETQVAQDAPLKPSMDIFAVGWVSLFLEPIICSWRLKVFNFIPLLLVTNKYVDIQRLFSP